MSAAAVRICLVSGSIGAGGAERVLTAMAGHWVRRGQEVTLLTHAGAGPDFYPPPEGVRRIRLGIPLRSGSRLSVATGLFRRVVALRRALRELAPDVVVSFIETNNVMVIPAARSLGLPVVVSERVDPRFFAINRVLAALRRITYPHAQALVVQSPNLRPWASAFVGARRAFVVPNPVAAAPAQVEGVRLKRPAVVAMGRFCPQKGFDLLLRCFASVRPRHPEWTLYLFGDGPERGALEALSRELRLGDALLMPGITSNAFGVLQSADLFVLSSRFEGFPNVLLEAMASGCACIAFDCPSGPADILRDAVDGLLVPQGDVRALAETLDQLMSDPERRKLLGSRAKEVVERYSLQRVMELWDEVLASAMDRR